MLRSIYLLTLCAVVVPAQAAEPLLEEFFKLDPARWEAQLISPQSGVEIRPCLVDGQPTGEIGLTNRAYLFSQATYPKGLDATIEWKWRETGGGKAYAENFLVLIRSTGKISPKWSHETMDGIRVRIDAGYGKISVDSVVDGKTSSLAHRFVQVRGFDTQFFDSKTEGNAVAVPDVEGNWYNTIRVKDDGGKINVYFNGEEACSAKYDAALYPGTRFGLGNREIVGGSYKISYIRRVVITPKK